MNTQASEMPDEAHTGLTRMGGASWNEEPGQRQVSARGGLRWAR